MRSPEAPSGTEIEQPKNAPPCKRCSARDWHIEERPKARVRWILETIFAAPDVWIFQSESAGWPTKTYQRWTCGSCGRTVRVS